MMTSTAGQLKRKREEEAVHEDKRDGKIPKLQGQRSPVSSLEAKSEENKPAHALSCWDDIASSLRGKKIVVFLDYDGTLTPIVKNPAEAIITEKMRSVVEQLAKRYDTAIVTGRSVDTILHFLRLDNLYYAGSHGFDIRGPDKQRMKTVAEKFLPALQSCYKELHELFKSVPGAIVEDNVYCISVHYRNVEKEEDIRRMETSLDDVLTRYQQLCKRTGKKVWEVRPATDWDKGKAVSWLLENVFKAEDVKTEILPIYMGDDVTDEDAFRMLNARKQGFGVHVRKPGVEKHTAAQFFVEGIGDVETLLGLLLRANE